VTLRRELFHPLDDELSLSFALSSSDMLFFDTYITLGFGDCGSFSEYLIA